MTAAKRLYACLGCERMIASRASRCRNCRWGKSGECLVDEHTPFEEDIHAKNIAAMAQLSGGCPLEVIGEATNLSKQRVEQIVAKARKKLAKAFEDEGIDASDIAHILATRHASESFPSTAGYPSTTDIGETKVRRRREAFELYVSSGPESEEGKRVEAAIEALEIAAVRAYLASGGE